MPFQYNTEASASALAVWPPKAIKAAGSEAANAACSGPVCS